MPTAARATAPILPRHARFARRPRSRISARPSPIAAVRCWSWAARARARPTCSRTARPGSSRRARRRTACSCSRRTPGAAAEMRGRIEVADRHALRRAVGLRRPGPVRADPARRGTGGRARPAVRAGQRRRPAGAAARADRRPAAAPPRDPRQPGAAPGRLRRAHRPPEGGDGPRAATSGAGPRRTATRRRADDERTHAERELEFAHVYAAHDRLLAQAARSTRAT